MKMASRGGTWQVKEYEVSAVNWGRRSKTCVFWLFSGSLCLQREGCSFPPGVERAPLTWGFYDLFQGGRPGGRSECPSCFCCFLSLLQLKIFNMPRCHIWGQCDLRATIHTRQSFWVTIHVAVISACSLYQHISSRDWLHQVLYVG